ncbi:MAG: ketopantoate reductase family protein [Advenella sp.]
MSTQDKTKVCVIGAGAIGGYLGVRLANSGAQVSVLARGQTLQAIQARGWILEEGQERLVAQVRASSDAAALGPQDIIILTVKTHALQDIAAMVPALCHADTIVIPAINGIPWWFTQGLDNSEAPAQQLPTQLKALDPSGVIADAIDARRIVGCVVYPSCYSPEPGVSHHSSGNRLVLGEISRHADQANQDRLDRVIALFNTAGLAAEKTSAIRSAVWEKLLGNACFNPVSMLTGSQTDLMIDDPAIYRLFVALMEEVVAVGVALGITVSVTPQQRLAVTRKLGAVKTSMLQDTEAGRPVEIEAILGAFVELATSLQTATPIATTVYALARMRAQTFGLLKQ